MTATFSRAIPLIVAVEGGYSDRTTDYGGKTKYGISQRDFQKINIAELSENEAMALLKERYWDAYRISEILDQNIANQAMLLIMNMNPLSAGKIIQLAVNAAGRGILNIKVDGVLGSKSLEAINTLNPSALSDRIRVEACKYYLQETDEDAKQIPNFRGWIRRALTS